MPDPNVELVLDAAAATAEGGPALLLERYDELFSEDFEWNPILLSSLDGRAYRGKAEFERYWEEFLAGFPDVRFSFDSAEAVDERRVLLTGEIRGTGAESGAPIDRPAAFIFEVADGKITAGRSFWSVADAREFLSHA